MARKNFEKKQHCVKKNEWRSDAGPKYESDWKDKIPLIFEGYLRDILEMNETAFFSEMEKKQLVCLLELTVLEESMHKK